jgi:hypothetical protein
MLLEPSQLFAPERLRALVRAHPCHLAALLRGTLD